MPSIEDFLKKQSEKKSTRRRIWSEPDVSEFQNLQSDKDLNLKGLGDHNLVSPTDPDLNSFESFDKKNHDNKLAAEGPPLHETVGDHKLVSPHETVGGHKLVSPHEIVGDHKLVSPHKPVGDHKLVSPHETVGDHKLVSPHEIVGDHKLVSPHKPVGDHKLVSPHETVGDHKLVSPHEIVGGHKLVSPHKPVGDHKSVSPHEIAGDTGTLTIGAQNSDLKHLNKSSTKQSHSMRPEAPNKKIKNNVGPGKIQHFTPHDFLSLSRNESKFLSKVLSETEGEPNIKVMIKRHEFNITDSYFYSSRKGLVEKGFILFEEKKDQKNRQIVYYQILAKS